MNQPKEWLYDNAVVERVFQSLKDEGLHEQPPETQGRKPPHWASTTSKWLTITSGGIRRWAIKVPICLRRRPQGVVRKRLRHGSREDRTVTAKYERRIFRDLRENLEG